MMAKGLPIYLVIIPFPAHGFAFPSHQYLPGPAHIPVKMFLEQLLFISGIIPKFSSGAEKMVVRIN